ncbi:hypothetical protein ABWH65_07740 [Pasteurella multocida]|uniref:hypothetical protein n=1 Tax=Pasteurella multocida TaxID=747 RepID=UPI00397B3811
MVMPTQQPQIPHCPRYGGKNDRIRPAGAACFEHPSFPETCPKCGGKTCFRPLTRVEKWKYRWGILKGFGC